MVLTDSEQNRLNSWAIQLTIKVISFDTLHNFYFFIFVNASKNFTQYYIALYILYLIYSTNYIIKNFFLIG